MNKSLDDRAWERFISQNNFSERELLFGYEFRKQMENTFAFQVVRVTIAFEDFGVAIIGLCNQIDKVYREERKRKLLIEESKAFKKSKEYRLLCRQIKDKRRKTKCLLTIRKKRK